MTDFNGAFDRLEIDGRSGYFDNPICPKCDRPDSDCECKDDDETDETKP